MTRARLQLKVMEPVFERRIHMFSQHAVLSSQLYGSFLSPPLNV